MSSAEHAFGDVHQTSAPAQPPIVTATTICKDVETNGNRGAMKTTAIPENTKRKIAPDAIVKTGKSDRTKSNAMVADEEDDGKESRPKKKAKTRHIPPTQSLEAEDPEASKDENMPESSKAKDQKPRTRKPSPPDDIIRAFVNGRKTIQTWSSNKITQEQVDLIARLDNDGQDVHEVTKWWREEMNHGIKDKEVKNKAAAIYKEYDARAPIFYAEKGLEFVSRDHVNKFLAREKKAAKATTMKGAKPRATSTRQDAGEKANRRKTGTKAGTIETASFPMTQTIAQDAIAKRAEPDKVNDFDDFPGPRGLPIHAQNLQELRVTRQESQGVRIDSQDARECHDDGMDVDEGAQSAKEMEDSSEHECDSKVDDKHEGDYAPTAILHLPFVAEAPPVPQNPQCRKIRFSAKEVQLKKLFEQTFLPKTKSDDITLMFDVAKPVESELEPSSKDIVRFHANRNSPDVLIFARTPGDAPLWHPCRPVLNRQCAAQHSTRLLDELEEQPGLRRVEYNNDAVDTDTIARYVACISPSLRTQGLPTHDIVEVDVDGKREVQCMPIEWNMDDAIALYRFAWYMGTPAICDMIKDRLHQEFHDGAEGTFDVTAISPAFLNELLRQRDKSGQDYFVDLLAASKEDGWRALKNHGLNYVQVCIQDSLIEALKHGDVTVAKTEWLNRDGTMSVHGVCHTYHQHTEDYDPCYSENGVELDTTPLPSTGRDAWYWKRQADCRASQIEAVEFRQQRRDVLQQERTVSLRLEHMKATLEKTKDPIEKSKMAEVIRAMGIAAAKRLTKREKEDCNRADADSKRSQLHLKEMEALEDEEDDMPYMELDPPRLFDLAHSHQTQISEHEESYTVPSKYPAPKPLEEIQFCDMHTEVEEVDMEGDEDANDSHESDSDQV